MSSPLPSAKSIADRQTPSVNPLQEPLLSMENGYESERKGDIETEEKKEKYSSVNFSRRSESTDYMKGRNYANNAPKIFLETITAKT
jgi:hypothetical protein